MGECNDYIGLLDHDECVHVLADKDDKLKHVVVDTTACGYVKCVMIITMWLDSYSIHTSNILQHAVPWARL